MQFQEIPLSIVGRLYGIQRDALTEARADGIRCFDARVTDGLIRVTLTARQQGEQYWFACVGHLNSFLGGRPRRLATDDEARQAIAAVRRLVTGTPELVEYRDPALPMRVFLERSAVPRRAPKTVPESGGIAE